MNSKSFEIKALRVPLMEFRVLEKKERFLCFQGKGDLPWPRKVLGRWPMDFVAVERFGRPNLRMDEKPIFPIRDSGRARPVPSLSVRPRGRFCRAKFVGRAEPFLPGSTGMVGPVGNCSAKFQ
ncbi:unnamed protein product [Microthlaspi erraticum]|uniref:Uncharacterized protein n=1 Tax=Microthlaspi erraticum TaxID=1685480 RepID=A0A6D2IZQ0_9BRAS|nr:unnamed protein product [Microthlaspi erraticum]